VIIGKNIYHFNQRTIFKTEAEMKLLNIILSVITIVLLAIVWTQLEKLWLEILLTVWLVVIGWIYIAWCDSRRDMRETQKQMNKQI